MQCPQSPVLAYTHDGRRPFPFRTVAVLAFTLPALLLWVRSYKRADSVTRMSWAGDRQIESNEGGLYFAVEPHDSFDPSQPPDDHVFYSWDLSRPSFAPWERGWHHPVRRWAGVQEFEIPWQTRTGPVPVRVVIVSDWVLAVIAAALGLAAGRCLPGLTLWLTGPLSAAWRGVRGEITIWTSKSD